MDDSHLEFQRRVEAISRKHRAFGQGMRATVQQDGLIVIKPQTARSRLPARGVTLMIAGFLVFKGLLLASLGPVTYDERMARLAAGSVAEQASAVVMVPDPISIFVAGKLRGLLR